MSCMYTCYDLIRPDVALELAWINNIKEFAFPYVLQFLREKKNEKDVIAQSNMYTQLLPLAFSAPPTLGMGGGYDPSGYGGMPPMPSYGMPGMSY